MDGVGPPTTLRPVRWLAVLLASIVAAAVTAVALAQAPGGEPDAPPAEPAPDIVDVVGEVELPALDERVPTGAKTLAAALADTAERLDRAADAWRREGDLGAKRPPEAVTRLATYESRIVAALAARPGLSRAVIPRLPGAVARRVAPEVRALRDLRRLHGISQRRPGPPPRIRLGRPQPLATLLGHYRAAQRRFGVRWNVLAAVNHVESKFGRLRNESISGARGPMQFMPATWRQYGLGGDVRDPRDAIMGAANYLHASGAPGNDARALHAYNPSDLYVRTVLLYADRIAADPTALPSLYAREVVR